MQDEHGLKRILKFAWVYETCQWLVGAAHFRKWLSQNLWRLKGGEKVVDVGCGPARILDQLPSNVSYVGFDSSAEYIAAARARYGSRGDFIAGTARELCETPDPRLHDADLIMCTGVLHHLDDADVLDILKLARSILTPTGRFVCLEPTFLAHQTRVSRWIVGKDRGQNVRSEAELKRLVAQVFPTYESGILTGMLRIPYLHIYFSCRNG